MRRPHLKLVRALDAILLEGGELRERLLLRVRRDLAPLAVHRARPVCQCLRSSREVGGAKCHQGALETALKAVENRYRPCQARVSPSACNFARRNGAQVAAVESATPTDLATARLGTLRDEPTSSLSARGSGYRDRVSRWVPFAARLSRNTGSGACTHPPRAPHPDHVNAARTDEPGTVMS